MKKIEVGDIYERGLDKLVVLACPACIDCWQVHLDQQISVLYDDERADTIYDDDIKEWKYLGKSKANINQLFEVVGDENNLN